MSYFFIHQQMSRHTDVKPVLLMSVELWRPIQKKNKTYIRIDTDLK